MTVFQLPLHLIYQTEPLRVVQGWTSFALGPLPAEALPVTRPVTAQLGRVLQDHGCRIAARLFEKADDRETEIAAYQTLRTFLRLYEKGTPDFEPMIEGLATAIQDQLLRTPQAAEGVHGNDVPTPREEASPPQPLTPLPNDDVDRALISVLSLDGYDADRVIYSKFMPDRSEGGDFSEIRVYRVIHRDTGEVVVARWTNEPYPIGQGGARWIQHIQNDPRFHSALVKVFQTGSLAYGSYSVMEEIVGRSMEERIVEKEQTNLNLLIEILRVNLEVEASLNGLGFTHGDLGMHNTALSEDGYRVYDYEHTRQTFGPEDLKKPLYAAANMALEYLFSGQMALGRLTRRDGVLKKNALRDILDRSRLFGRLQENQRRVLCDFLHALIYNQDGELHYDNSSQALVALEGVEAILRDSVVESSIILNEWPEFLNPSAFREAIRSIDDRISVSQVRIRSQRQFLRDGSTFCSAHKVALKLSCSGKGEIGEFILTFQPDKNTLSRWKVSDLQLKLEIQGDRYGFELMTEAIRYAYANPAITKISLSGLNQGKYVWRHFDGVRLSDEDLGEIHRINAAYRLGIPSHLLVRGMTLARLSRVVDLGTPQPDMDPAAREAFRYSNRPFAEDRRMTQFPGLIAFLLLPRCHATLDLKSASDYSDFLDSVIAFWTERSEEVERAKTLIERLRSEKELLADWA